MTLVILPWWGDPQIEIAALRALATYLPAQFTSGGAFEASIATSAHLPTAPTAYDSEGRPTDGAYYGTLDSTDETARPLPYIDVQCASQPQVDARLDSGIEVVQVTVRARYRCGIDAASNPQLGRQKMRQQAQTVAGAMEYVLLKYLGTMARTLDASTAYGISHVRKARRPESGTGVLRIKGGRELLAADGYLEVQVQQSRSSPLWLPSP